MHLIHEDNFVRVSPSLRVDMNGNSVFAQLYQFLKDNPGEYLTYKDISKKFGCSFRTATQVAYRLKKVGMAEISTVVHFVVENKNV